MESQRKNFFYLLLSLLGYVCIACFGGGATGWVLYATFVQQDEVELQHETWTQVPAQVTEFDIYRISSRYRNQSSHQWVRVHYRYTVDGVQHESDELGSMDRDRMPMFTAASRKAFGDGRRAATYLPDNLCCYVNPADPRDVRLFTDAEHTPLWWTALQTLLWLFVMLTGVMGCYWTLQEIARRCSRAWHRLRHRA